MKSAAPRLPRRLGALFALLLPITLGAAPKDPPPPAGSANGDARVKVVTKAVPCVPCPCECPEPRAVPHLAPGGKDYVEPGTEPPRVGPPNPGTQGGPGTTDTRPEVPRPPAPPPPPPRGTIAGTVLVRDRAGRERGDNSEVVVYIEKMPQRRYAGLKRSRAMAQRDKTFAPHVLAVTRGSTVEFPNEDKFFHNVFSLSEGNTFDLGLYRAGTSRSMTFEKTGVVDVYCNIHPNMWAQILVVDNPFYAVTGKDGVFEIPKVPAGTYDLSAWVSGSTPVKQQVRVDANGRAQVKFVIQEGVSSKPHLNKFNQPYGRYK